MTSIRVNSSSSFQRCRAVQVGPLPIAFYPDARRVSQLQDSCVTDGVRRTLRGVVKGNPLGSNAQPGIRLSSANSCHDSGSAWKPRGDDGSAIASWSHGAGSQ